MGGSPFVVGGRTVPPHPKRRLKAACGNRENASVIGIVVNAQTIRGDAGTGVSGT
jgi:hypothetical protein